MYQETFRLDIKKIFSAKRVAKHWNRLPGEVVESPALEEIKRLVDVLHRDIAYWWTWQY